MLPKAIDFNRYNKIIILTGAGISAASGLPTFRGVDGIMSEEIKWVSDATNLPTSLPKLWQLYGELRRLALNADYAKARTILINLTPMQPNNPYFQEEYLGEAEIILPILLGFN
jgi:NAD-dependent SIR2 family protein deacetylase